MRICTFLLIYLILYRASLVAEAEQSDERLQTSRISRAICDPNTNTLGMESGAITDAQLTASSSFDKQSVGPQNARIRTEMASGAWCPKQQIRSTSTEYLEVDLLTNHMVGAVETQGRYGNGTGREFTQFYFVDYQPQSESGGMWTRYRNGSDESRIEANENTVDAAWRSLRPPILARRIRIVPYAEQTRTACLRLELYGCPATKVLNTETGKSDSADAGVDAERLPSASSSPHAQYYYVYTSVFFLSALSASFCTLVALKRRRKRDGVHLFKSLTGPKMLIDDGKMDRRKASTVAVGQKYTTEEKKCLEADGQVFVATARLAADGIPRHILRTFLPPPSVAARHPHPPPPAYSTTRRTHLENRDCLDSDEPESQLRPSLRDIHFPPPPPKSPPQLPPRRNRIRTVATLSVSHSASAGLRNVDCDAEASRLLPPPTRQRSALNTLRTSISSLSAGDDAPTEWIGLVVADASSPRQKAMSRPQHRRCCANASLTLPTRTRLKAKAFEKYQSSSLSPSLEEDECHCRCVSTASSSSASPTPATCQCKTSSEDDDTDTSLIHPRSTVCVGASLADGKFTTISECKSDLDGWAHRRLVIKTQRPGLDIKAQLAARQALIAEAQALAALRHPNLVRLVGSCDDHSIITLRCEWGDVRRALTNSRFHVDYEVILVLCTQLSAAMKYLEENGIVHGHLSPRSCLMEADTCPTCSHSSSTLRLRVASPRGANLHAQLRFSAPEAIILNNWSSKTDAWSFAATAWELLHRCRITPFESLTNAQILDNARRVLYNPTSAIYLDFCRVERSIFERCPTAMLELLSECWNAADAQRPSFLEIHLFFSKLVKETRTID